MSGLKQKKKSLKNRKRTLLKDPSIALKALVDIADAFLRDLDSNVFEEPYQLPKNSGETIRFKRYSK